MQIGELSGGLSEEYRKATSSRVQWGPMKGMRNLVAHSYGSMNREIIWETAVNDIPTLKQFCEEQLAENRKLNDIQTKQTEFTRPAFLLQKEE